MKYWTQQQARDDGTVEAAGYSTEIATASSAAASLDRTQLPRLSIAKANIQDYALHRVYVIDMDDFNPTYPGEQSTFRETGCVYWNWQAASYKNYGGGEVELFSIELPDGKEGLYQIELKGNYYVHPYWGNSLTPINPKNLSIGIYLNGVQVLKTQGFVRPMGSFYLVGAGAGVGGTNTLSITAQFNAAGRQDAIVINSTNYEWIQWHLACLQAVVIGRWR